MLGAEDAVALSSLLAAAKGGELDHLGFSPEFSVAALGDMPSVDWR